VKKWNQIRPLVVVVALGTAAFASEAKSRAASASVVAPAVNAADTRPQNTFVSGKADDAIAALQARLAKSESDAEAHHLLSRALLALGRIDDAMKEGERAVQLAPNNAEYHLWLGRAYGQKAEKASFLTAAGYAKKLKVEFERAVELQPNNMDARSDLFEFYLEAPSIVGGGKDKARAAADEIAKRDAAQAHWVNARIAEKDKDFTKAELEYKAAIASGDGRADRWLNLASFYRRQNRLQDMEMAINKAVSSQRKPSNVLFDAASLLYRAGMSLPQAATLVGKYIAGKDKAEEAPAFQAHYLLGQILEKQGDKAGAAKEYEASLALASSYSPAKDALRRVKQ
jgi:tetratricopeptide (TPR) repeat protein